MTSNHPLLTLLLCTSIGLAADLPVIIPDDYKITWSDEFDGDTLDVTKWGFPAGKKTRGSATMNEPGTVAVKDGMLHLNAFEKNGELHCAMIQTSGKFTQKYGWFEARVKMHRLAGMHSAFWLQSPTFSKTVDSPAKSGTEIDIIEWFGTGDRNCWAGMNIYYWGSKHGKPAAVRSSSVPKFHLMGGPVEGDPKSPIADLNQDFHVYALHWTPEACVFYCDGVEIMREEEAVSQTPEYMILSLLCDPWERPRLDVKKLPDGLQVDYVRVYAPKDAPAVAQ